MGWTCVPSGLKQTDMHGPGAPSLFWLSACHASTARIAENAPACLSPPPAAPPAQTARGYAPPGTLGSSKQHRALLVSSSVALNARSGHQRVFPRVFEPNPNKIKFVSKTALETGKIRVVLNLRT